jgi:2-methylcitrate dehydratase PrpD
VADFMKRIRIEDDPDAKRIANESEPEHLGFRKTSASVIVKAKGKVFTEKAEYAKGNPWDEKTRLSNEELIEKFKRFTTRLTRPSKSWNRRIEKIIDLILNLENMDNVNGLTRLFKIEYKSTS